MSLIIGYHGLDADKHLLEALAGTESIAGISRSLAIIANYAATGKVKHRSPTFSDELVFYLQTTEAGSFKWKYVVVGATTIGLGLATNALYDLGKLAISQAIGEEPTDLCDEVKELNEKRGGDIEALVEAIEPALKRAHYGIGDTASNIIIINGNNNKTIVKFNENSKNYLRTSINGDMNLQDVSISALNINNKTGRAYFADLGRTIPFLVGRDATGGTIPTLSNNLNNNANKQGLTTQIKYQPLLAADGRIKRVIILDARDVSNEE